MARPSSHLTPSLSSASVATDSKESLKTAFVSPSEKDRKQFKKYNKAYEMDPVQTSELALEALFKEPHWRDHWDYFLEQMVYEEDKPSFDKACGCLQDLSEVIFMELREERQK